jgi:hypothetical protein
LDNAKIDEKRIPTYLHIQHTPMTPPGQGFREDQGSISSEFGHKIIAKKRQFIKNNIMIYSYKLAVFNLYTVTTTMTMSVANFISFSFLTKILFHF